MNQILFETFNIFLITLLKIMKRGKVKHKLRDMSSTLRVTSSNPRVMSSNPRVMSSNPSVTSSNL